MADRIECVEPIFDAWDKMKELLLSPIRVSDWFVIGFTAWLANLGQGYGGGGANIGSNISNLFNLNIPKPPAPAPVKPTIALPDSLWSAAGNPEFRRVLDSMREITDKLGVGLGLIAVIVVFAVCLLIIIGLLMAWLKARGEFMFIHNLALDRAEIVPPWSEYGAQANSVFLWRIGLAILSSLVGVLLIGVATLLCLNWISTCVQMKTFQAPDGLAITGIIFFVVSLSLTTILLLVINVLFNNFVIPVMFKKRTLSLDACQDVIALFKATPLAFVKYLLALLVLNMVVNSAIYFLAYITCCIGLILLSIPYIWAVLLLPVLSFFRLYSLCFLAQFGDEYDVFPKLPESLTPQTPATTV